MSGEIAYVCARDTKSERIKTARSRNLVAGSRYRILITLQEIDTGIVPPTMTLSMTLSDGNGASLLQLRKKEPPHPIRVAKTIDVIARITFPVAYFVFLTFFFIHYKGTS
jgi:hypothetical protein